MAGESSNESRKSVHVVIPPELKERLSAVAKQRGTAIGFQIQDLIEVPLREREAELKVAGSR